MLALVLLVSMQVPDVCPNIPGDQPAVPSGMTLIEGFCVPDQEPVVVMPPPKPKVRITPPSAAVMAIPGYEVAQIDFSVTIENADEELWCPGIRWEVWAGTTKVQTLGSQEGDCKPFTETTPEDRAYRNWHRPITLGSGSWAVRAVLYRGGKVIKVLTSTIVVQGGSL